MGDGRKFLPWILSPCPARARLFFTLSIVCLYIICDWRGWIWRLLRVVLNIAWNEYKVSIRYWSALIPVLNYYCLAELDQPEDVFSFCYIDLFCSVLWLEQEESYISKSASNLRVNGLKYHSFCVLFTDCPPPQNSHLQIWIFLPHFHLFIFQSVASVT